MHRFLLFSMLLITSFSSLTLLAQDAEESEESRVKHHSIGLTAGGTSGYGFFYRFTSQMGLGAQASYGIFKSETDFNQFVSFGLLFNLIETDKTSFFLYESNGIWLYRRSFEDSYYYYPEEYDFNRNLWSHALGFGMEFRIEDMVGLDFQFGIGSYENFNYVAPSGEISVSYKF